MTERITAVDTIDVRFPTSVHRDGSDAMNPFPDYSAAYVTLRTSAGAEGHGLVFTVGRGTEIQVAAVRSLAAMVVGQPVDELTADPGALARRLVGDSQIRWLGPAKGVVHMAAGGLVNAVWDLAARRAGKPLWKLLADLTPEQLVAQVDFRYLRDALTEDEALTLLRQAADGRAGREQRLRAEGYPAYTTTPGWLGYDDEKLARLCAEAVRDGYRLIKLKVGGDLADDVRRMGIARRAVGPQVRLAVDANQIWGVPEAIGWMRELAAFDPYWIEEPTSPDDVLGHAAVRKALSPIRVATGEHVHNAVVFKQLLQADAVDVVQIDACRVAGVNENLAILLLAARFGVPVCPHAGGVGLCELVQHLAMFDFVAVSGSTEDRAIEYVDHLHDHFVDPVRVTGGRYLAPTAPGMSGQIRPESLAAYRFPDGPQWADAAATPGPATP
ncbi:enolase C-terminal domain-like protein [Micromonospora sp. HUAS LYJ1]|uniref:enolase C-terminal domain-like protein n=1 Tax=Micromonospora sp. HUAS LYJ1 TaxID=3061626 RepID=UPI0026723CE2|nr:enolase C-terminal domain-like protein [Micromonospora sp. HUAS LYJ1]WKU07039.1 enolase C-terminal domain-like protein [Micromonospora sp. HUAS LYJ1]